MNKFMEYGAYYVLKVKGREAYFTTSSEIFFRYYGNPEDFFKENLEEMGPFHLANKWYDKASTHTNNGLEDLKEFYSIRDRNKMYDIVKVTATTTYVFETLKISF
jgi:hypothetical protein